MKRCRSSLIRNLRFEVVGLALLVFLGGVDLHGPNLNDSTFASPHPVLYESDRDSHSGHVEAADSALRPAHEPIRHSRPLPRGVLIIVRPLPVAPVVRRMAVIANADLPRPAEIRIPHLRGPPAA